MKYDYDIIVIGGGAAGLTSAGLAASLGAKTALIEAKKTGGDCTWYGCVPSKTLLKAAKVADTFRTADRYGIKNQTPIFDIKNIIQHIKDIQEHIYEEADKPEIYRNMGVDVIDSFARFIDRNTLEVCNEENCRRITSKYIIIATGSTPYVPQIQGLDQINYHTNETIFSIDELPQKMLVVGAGPIGSEMSQAFTRLGSEVVVVTHSEKILPNDDPELTLQLKEILESEGIKYKTNYEIKNFSKKDEKIAVTISSGKDEETLLFDAVLISTGRKPTIDKLALEKANVNFNNKGIIIDKYCRTNINNIFAVGDCAGSYQFTHYAENMAKKAVSTALLKIQFKTEPDNITWCTYTDPELAHVGLTPAQLKERNINYKVYKFPFSKIDRAITESNTDGWIKIYAKKLNGKIYGVDILGHNAGEMISEFALAIKNNIPLRKIADTIHPYPTYLLGNRRVADQWYIQKQSRFLVKLIMKIFDYHGQLPDTSDPDRIM